MAINRDPAEWFDSLDSWADVTYGILKGTDTWFVLRRTYNDFGNTEVESVAEVDSRQAAIGFIKLLVEI
jgi:hypothetical protein